VNPGAREICFDMLDNDCDGWIDNLATCTRDEAGTRVKGGGLCSTGGAGAASGLVLLGLALAAARRRRA
jgi:MYXO-CTERM domain-containing protein